VTANYANLQIHGWGLYRMKEKLKVLKKEICAWNKGRFDNLEERTLILGKEINALDIRNEQHGLSSDELA